jgi:hypothetical protein
VNKFSALNYTDFCPTRVLVATVRNLGGCPCPRCLIPKERIQNMGMPRDRTQRVTLGRDDERRGMMVNKARSLIYEENYAVGSARVEQILKSQSWVPTSVRFELLSLKTANNLLECILRPP